MSGMMNNDSTVVTKERQTDAHWDTHHSHLKGLLCQHNSTADCSDICCLNSSKAALTERVVDRAVVYQDGVTTAPSLPHWQI